MVKSFHADFPKHHSIPALDGVRGLSCLMVVFFHAGLAGWFPAFYKIGTLGVMLFFSLSGFLMALHYSPQSHSKPYWIAFYLKRYVRLYPTFVCVVLLGRLLYPHLFIGEKRIYESVPNELYTLLLFIDGSVFWTIPNEFTFYLVYPFLAFFFTRAQTHAFSFKTFVALWFVWLVIAFTGGLPDWNYYIYFLGGMIAAYSVKGFSFTPSRIHYFWDLTAWFTIACITVVLVYYNGNNGRSWIDISGDSYVFSPLLALFLLSIAKSRGIICKILAFTPLRSLGIISYSMYLTHNFVLFSGAELLPDYLHYAWFITFLVLLVAVSFYFIVEKPFHTLSVRCARKIMHKSVLR